MLDVVGKGLQSVSEACRDAGHRKMKRAEKKDMEEAMEEHRKERVKRGTWHDARLDCVAGNGVMSELGVGDERLDELDSSTASFENFEKAELVEKERERERRKMTLEDKLVVACMPVIVIQNFASAGGANKTEFLDVLAQWAAALVENKVGSYASFKSGSHTTWSQVAYVVVISDNRENMKRLAKGEMSLTRALPASDEFTLGTS